MNTRGDAREAHDLPKSVGAHGDAGAPARESAEVLHRDTLGRQGPQRGMTRARGGGGVTHDLPATDGKGLAGAPDCEGAEVLHHDTRGRHGPQRGMVLARGRDVAEARDLPAGIDPESVAEVPAREGAKISDAARYGSELRTRRGPRGCCRLPGIPTADKAEGCEKHDESLHGATSVRGPPAVVFLAL